MESGLKLLEPLLGGPHFSSADLVIGFSFPFSAGFQRETVFFKREEEFGPLQLGGVRIYPSFF